MASGYQVTFDTTGYIGNYPLEAAVAPGAADAIFVMGYDYRTAGSSPVGSIAPLHRTGYDITDTIDAYTARVPASKLILGVPYYGRAWSTDSDQRNAANISGTKYGSSTAVIYANGIGILQQHGKRTDPTEGVAWTVYRRQNCTATYGCVNPWRQLYMDDAYTLRSKYDLINSRGLRGAGIWALGYDDDRPELYTAIKDKFIAREMPFRDVDKFYASVEWMFFQGIHRRLLGDEVLPQGSRDPGPDGPVPPPRPRPRRHDHRLLRRRRRAVRARAASTRWPRPG